MLHTQSKPTLLSALHLLSLAPPIRAWRSRERVLHDRLLRSTTPRIELPTSPVARSALRVPDPANAIQEGGEALRNWRPSWSASLRVGEADAAQVWGGTYFANLEFNSPAARSIGAIQVRTRYSSTQGRRDGSQWPPRERRSEKKRWVLSPSGLAFLKPVAFTSQRPPLSKRWTRRLPPSCPARRVPSTTGSAWSAIDQETRIRKRRVSQFCTCTLSRLAVARPRSIPTPLGQTPTRPLAWASSRRGQSDKGSNAAVASHVRRQVRLLACKAAAPILVNVWYPGGNVS